MAFDKVRLVSTNNKVLILFYSLFLFEKQSVPITIKVLNPSHGEMYSIQHYVKKFVSDLRQVGSFLQVFRFPQPIKLTEILLKVVLNTIIVTNGFY